MRVGPCIGTSGGPRIGLGGGAAPECTLTVSIADSADPVITGADPFSYTVDVTVGDADATNVEVAVTLDASLAYVSASGTGWMCNHSGGVVTCTRASGAVGALATITINVTTGGSALTASTVAVADASNATAPDDDTETTVIALVTKDATANIYFPADSAEWTSFIARKGLSIAVPSALHNFQDASGNITDQIGSLTLTASLASGYQQSESGYTRKAVTTPAGSGYIRTTSASLPDPASASHLSLVVARWTDQAVQYQILYHGSTTYAYMTTNLTNDKLMAYANNGGASATGAASTVGVVRPYSYRYNRTATTITAFSDADKISPAWTANVGKSFYLESQAPLSILYAAHWFAANAEVSDANWSALLTALGWTITWS